VFLESLTLDFPLFHKKRLLNIFKYPEFAFSLISHKIIRWLVPWLMVTTLVSNFFLVEINLFYKVLYYLQMVFYSLTIIAAFKIFNIQERLPGKISLYFTLSNLAILFAWFKYWRGESQEIWQPSSRH